MRGPGETQLETDRRLARTRIALLRRRLRETAQQRGLMRRRRDAQRGAVGRARRLHQRRQVDAAERAHRRRGVDRQPPLRDARPDHARLRPPRAHVHRHRHRRLHPQAAARPRGGVRVHARGDARRRPAAARGRRLRAGGGARRAAAGGRGACWSEIGADDLPRLLVLNKVDLRATRRRAAGCATPIPTRCWSRRAPARASTRSRSAIAELLRGALRAASSCSCRTTPGRVLADLYALGAPIEEREDTAVGVRIRAHLLGGRGPPLRRPTA